MKKLLKVSALVALVVAVDVLVSIAQGPLTPLMTLRGRTDANGYLIATMSPYTGPDGPLTALANLRGRTDANGYLLTTTGAGLFNPIVVADTRTLAQSGAVATVATYTVGSTDATFDVSSTVTITAGTAFNFQVQASYTDESNSARVLPLWFTTAAGAFPGTIQFSDGLGIRAGMPSRIRAKAATTVLLQTQAAGTYTGVTYNIEGIIMRIF